MTENAQWDAPIPAYLVDGEPYALISNGGVTTLTDGEVGLTFVLPGFGWLFAPVDGREGLRLVWALVKAFALHRIEAWLPRRRAQRRGA